MRSCRVIVCVIGFAILAAPGAAQAQRAWRQIHREAAFVVTLDTTRIARSPDGAYTVVLRWNYAAPRRAENRRTYTRMIQHVQIACTPPIRVKRFGAALYTPNGTLVEEARALTAAELRFMAWDTPPTRSEGARVYPAVCRALAARRN